MSPQHLRKNFAILFSSYKWVMFFHLFVCFVVSVENWHLIRIATSSSLCKTGLCQRRISLISSACSEPQDQSVVTAKFFLHLFWPGLHPSPCVFFQFPIYRGVLKCSTVLKSFTILLSALHIVFITAPIFFCPK